MRHFLVMSIAAMLLFVVVCPLTPTPTAVVSGNTHAPQMHAIVLTIVCLVALFASKLLIYPPGSEDTVTHNSVEVLDLTCVQIC